jgi:uncharacterized protein YbjT (DUF2867 family)
MTTCGMSIQKIAVIGATGMLGLPVVRALVAAGFDVTALVRNPQSAARMLPPEVRCVEADVFDEESLRRGLAGQDAVYLNLSVAPGARPCDLHTEAQGLVHILSAARWAGIKRVGYLSALIQDAPANRWWVIDLWRRALAQIKHSGIPHTIFYASNFMETLPERHMLGRALVVAGTGHFGNYWIAGADYGRQVARAFVRTDAENRAYFVQGPEALSYGQAAQRYAKACPRPLRVVRVPLWGVRLLGLISNAMRFNARVLREVLKYPEEFKAQSAWDELGRPTLTIEDFARGTSQPPVPDVLNEEVPAPGAG